MKKIRRGFFIILCIVMLISMTACKPNVPEIEGTLEELLAKIYENAQVENKPLVWNVEVTPDNIISLLGSAEVKYTEALASEGMMMTTAHSIVLLRVAKDTNIEQTKKLIKDNIDPWKWICTGIRNPDRDVIVDNIGSLIILIMSNDDAEAYHASFKALSQS